MKKLLLGIFAFMITATYAQDGIEVSVSGNCEASGGITWQELMSGHYAYSGLFNGKDLHIRTFEYQGDQVPMSIRFDNTKWILQLDESSEAIFQNTSIDGTFPPLTDWEPAVDLVQEGCTADIYMAVLLTATPEISSNQELTRIFPNPVSEQFQLVNANPQDRSYSMTDLTGKLVKTGTVDQNDAVFIGDLSEGNYMLTCTGKDNAIRHLKLIKR